MTDRCTHPEEMIKPDLLHGARRHNAIQWCGQCGAYRHIYFAPVNDPNRVKQGEVTTTDWEVPLLQQQMG